MISNLRPSRAVIVRYRYRPATLGEVDDRRCRATTIGDGPVRAAANTFIVCMSTFDLAALHGSGDGAVTSSPLATIACDETGATGRDAIGIAVPHPC
ncbi:hypothetical protein BSL82_11275 [Tardibacter chloracetimidivorans]|uniref:Uncharacterized protein n=1 Tax=Tardibacter chloracetimidivorans TaxID=1921510 RepID=A0A1L3ZVZ3_9SPHN|nr:hypothetical protein BSL82_11275 [Tardibacter chloracetimidivorans]